MSRKTIEEKLKSKKYKRPNKFIYSLLVNVVVKGLAKKYGTTFKRNVDMKEYKNKQFILIGNHASRADYIYASLAVGADVPLNFILGHNEFYRSHLSFIVNLVNCIPKKNFVPDMLTIRGVKSVLSSGGNICFFPEGMSSISGAQQPVALGTAKFLKHYKLPVLMIKIKGGYLTNTKYCLDERPGKTEAELSELFTPTDLQNYSLDEITEILDKELYHDDYEWNKQKQYSYDCKGLPEYHIHQLLFKCPVCEKEFCITDGNGKITCSDCGLEIGMDEKYNLYLPKNVNLPATPAKWLEWERRMIRREVLNPEFEISEKVKLGVLPDYKLLTEGKTSLPAGEGLLTLNRKGLYYNGTKDGKDFNLFIECSALPSLGMCTDARFFYTLAKDGKYYEFTPLEHHSGEKWMLCVEEVHRVNGGKWQNYKWFDYDDLTEGFVTNK